ncbi:Serine/Threonine protein kinase, catalytic domain [Rhizoctonia solani]|uniref:non-specific serine/threonine protein kinase n=1 Tax=Rhizoctonia solani TaxID=456999 RepID=A0A8H7IDD7_9AGAM|nr:Serine/Threonine protein kinase, catalytic domain [Rhizoctonia solani]
MAIATRRLTRQRSVWASALNWTTGETVAVKQILLSDVPKSELGELMSEINLLKILDHPNIVKYKGYVKTRDCLYIILEYCENGSLHNICKRFGKFPENLVAVYIAQVLDGLVYLHEQGVIHRDIKGANILTNKDGTVKLADFGVATTPTGAINDAAVVGSPYWMAPEVIEQSGATTASDIWSVGCVVIELLEGHPPYHFLDPMPALFRIVQDDCPPIPEGASPVVKDFLYQCFQKDCNLRISAKKLLKHPWMTSVRKQMKTESVPGQRPLSNYDEAVREVQQWNEALKCASVKHINSFLPELVLSTLSSTARQQSRTRSRTVVDVGNTSPTPGPTDPFANNWPAPRPIETKGGKGVPPIGVTSPLGAGISGVSLMDQMKLRELERELENKALRNAAEEDTDNWDDDFEGGISFTKLHALDKSTDSNGTSGRTKSESEENGQTIRPTRSPTGKSTSLQSPAPMSTIIEDYSDLGVEDEDMQIERKVASFKMKNGSRRGLFHPDDIPRMTRPTVSELALDLTPTKVRPLSGQFARPDPSPITPPPNLLPFSADNIELRRNPILLDHLDDEDEDYEDVFGKPGSNAPEVQMHTLQLNTRLSKRSWLGDENSDEEDPFAEIDEGFDEHDLETNLNRDRHARNGGCDELLGIMTEAPEMQAQLVSSHGMLTILEVLESKPSRDVIIRLLKIINLLVTSDFGFLESFCLIGGIPVVMSFTTKKYSTECRIEASNFIRVLCQTSVLTLQMFISCRGLKVLVDLLDEDYSNQTNLVAHALNGIGSVFELQGPTPKNDFCRMFIREGLLDPLSSALLNVIASHGEVADEMKTKILIILLVFCQVSHSDGTVRNALGARKIIRRRWTDCMPPPSLTTSTRLVRACELLEPEHLAVILKAVKHLSMNPTLLDALQNATPLKSGSHLDEHSTGPHSAEEAAQAGIIPNLVRIAETDSPLKQFALPILCDLLVQGKAVAHIYGSKMGLSYTYVLLILISRLALWKQYWPGCKTKLRVLRIPHPGDSLEALLKCFTNSKANSFEGLLDPFLKICRLSQSITLGISSKSQFFRRITDRIGHGKPVARLNLLRILRAVFDVHPDRPGLVRRYGLLEIVERLSKNDGAVLVRELAREILPSLQTPEPPLALNRSMSRTGMGTPALTLHLGFLGLLHGDEA